MDRKKFCVRFCKVQGKTDSVDKVSDVAEKVLVELKQIFGNVCLAYASILEKN